MRIRLSSIVYLLWFLPAAVAAAAIVPGPPTLNVGAYVLMDFDSGHVIAERNMHKKMEPASLTKMMTIFTVAQELKLGTITLDDQVPVSEKAWRMSGSRMFIEVGKNVRLEDLMKGDIIQSGNDASVALAEYVSGTEEVFASLMNQNANRLGMKETHYVNSTGLPDPEHQTSAYDVAILARALIHDFPDVYRWFSTREFTYNDITQKNRNRLLWLDEDVDGIKTGYTEDAGYCLAASAVRDGQRLISVVMGAESEPERVKASQALLNYGFRFFETHRLYDAGTAITKVRIWKGDRDSVALGVAEPLYVTVPRGSYESLDASMNIDSQIIAPVVAGARLGTLEVRLDGDTLADRPLIALGSVGEGSSFERIWDGIKLLFE